MDLLAAKMRATTAVTLFVTFLIAVGCSSAEVNEISEIEIKKILSAPKEPRILQATSKEIAMYIQEDKENAIKELAKVFKQELFSFKELSSFTFNQELFSGATGATGATAAGVATATARVVSTATAAAAAAAAETLEELKVKASGFIDSDLGGRIGRQIVFIGKVANKVDNNVGNIGKIERGNGRHDVRIINSVDTYIGKYVGIIGTVESEDAIAVKKVVSTPKLELKPHLRKSLLNDVRKSLSDAVQDMDDKERDEMMAGGLTGGLMVGMVVISSLIERMMQALEEELNFSSKERKERKEQEDTLKASSRVRTAGSSWIQAEFFLSLTIFLAAAVAVFLGICRKTKIGSKKVSFSKEMK